MGGAVDLPIVPRVLIVDDSVVARDALAQLVEPFGVELAFAENGAEAVAQTKALRWDLIFLDVMMPVMDGIEAIHAIRGNGVTTPVVLATSVMTASTVARAVKLKNVTYISKPYRPETVRVMTTKLLGLDEACLRTPPRVLVQHPDPSVARELATALPRHVAVDATTSLAESLGVIEQHAHAYALVLFAPPATGDFHEDARTFGGVLRDALPAAAIFALANADGDGATVWRCDGPLDGVLPSSVAPFTRAFLYATCVRPLVHVRGTVITAAGYAGAGTYAPAYLAMVERALVAACERLEPTLELELDVRAIDAEPAQIVDLVSRLHVRLKARGALSYRVSELVRHELAPKHGLLLAA